MSRCSSSARSCRPRVPPFFLRDPVSKMRETPEYGRPCEKPCIGFWSFMVPCVVFEMLSAEAFSEVLWNASVDHQEKSLRSEQEEKEPHVCCSSGSRNQARMCGWRCLSLVWLPIALVSWPCVSSSFADLLITDYSLGPENTGPCCCFTFSQYYRLLALNKEDTLWCCSGFCY